MLPKRVRAIFLIAVVSCFALWGMPARSQPADEATASEEATASPKAEKIEPPPQADPKAAVTTKDPEIPVEELQLLVKPLALDELANEAAAWQLLLQQKVKEISDAEIAIKRQNRSIKKQQEVAGSLDEAKKALEESDKALKSAAPDSAEYKEATKKAEEAKEKLKKAQEGLKEATQTKKELKQDSTLNDALKKAEKTGELDQAKQTLDEAKKEREKIPADSPAYTAATEKIDALDKAIKAYEDAEKAQKAIADPKSPEYQEVTQKLEEATAQVKKAREAISGTTTTGGTGAAEKSAQKLDEATSTLENTTIKTGGETPTAGSSAANSQANQDKKGQLEKTSDKLEANAKDESVLKNQLVVNATNLQSGRTAVVDRFNVILEELDRKGGESKYYRKYIEAITKAEIDVKDTEGLGVRVLSWFKSDEGGLRWASNIGKFVGIVLASMIVSQILGLVISKLLKLSKTSKLMRQFTVVVINRGGIVVGVLLALTALEVSLAPVLTVLGGASFIFAFALQSNLGNFASGLMIMVYKPFDVGDEVKIGSLWGWVDSISLANTKIKGFGGQLFTVPNNTVWGETIENLTTSETRKVKFSFRISFDQDVTNIEKVLVDIFKSHPQILEEPAPSTFVFDLEDEYINLIASGWAKTDEFWKVSADILRTIQTRFEQEGIKLGAPAQDIRIIPESDENNSLTLDREFTEKQLLHPETAKPTFK
ncbi:MAG: mechanosensitive ion channel protein [Oscillatoriales cyanobacterium]|nr:MAG: mechanosensitive ion channel protein [Oscillatoriales cyanobacterium]TAD95894.1 MAG: mechanosensitive ion channel protein [Oscillatoriales cyanobacterium]TAE04327.1 MAG: mechanosensitive ion channel protein [Oscillatoriales cyanobacterium]TAE96607.1 MAG: mechanosensitive ion channel protein [Oscillatoriales cyanobacterium]TAF40221.1 MAG: mechanosensitive ion channel protein [Oscillatoriales cyanobacterium]